MRTFLTFFCCLFLELLPAQAQDTLLLSGKESISQLSSKDYFINKKITLLPDQHPFIKLSRTETKVATGVPSGIKSFETEFTPDVLIATERKINYALVQIPRYIKQEGQILELSDFDLQIIYPQGSSEVAQGGVPSPLRPTDVTQSVLASGTWYKIAVPKRGLYKIDYDFLQSMGLQPGQIDPKKIRIYGNGGTILPERVDDNDPDDLIQNAIYVKASGSRFQQGDYVLFYANGPMLWEADSLNRKFKHQRNYYEDQSYYFLTVDMGNGKRVASESATGAAAQTFTYFDDYQVYNRDSFNVKSIGKTWWSDPMNSQTGVASQVQLQMNLGDLKDTVFARVHVGNENTANNNQLSMSVNGQTVETFLLPSAYSSNYYADAFSSFSFLPGSPDLSIKFKYQPNGNGRAFIDFIELNYKRPLRFSGNSLIFRNWQALQTPSGQKVKYEMANAPANLTVWDISNPLEPIALTGTRAGNTYQVVRSGGTLSEYLAFSGSNFPKPKFISQVANQNLHGLAATDMLIITHKDLIEAANAFAQFHREHSGLKVTVATVDKIYNEFSSGGQDISGIRNFIKMFYDRSSNQNDMIKSVLLLGNASYDYKNRTPNNTNLVPTYETLTGVDEIMAFSTDDFFALLDHGEFVQSNQTLLDVAIGRIPANNNQEALTVLNKMKTYVGPASFGPWKNNITFVADDHDEGALGMNHLNDCETINQSLQEPSSPYILYKIYADAYKMVSGAGGNRYPDVNNAINDRIFNGTFFMGYSGHGNESRWAQEAILTPADYNEWKNITKLPIMFTGTCDFGRFDNPEVDYAGIKLLMNPNGGSIAMITTTQAVFANGNTELGTNFIREQFQTFVNEGHYSLGEAIRIAKNNSSQGYADNKVKFVLLGDPALMPPIPSLLVKTDSILTRDGGQNLSVPTDTLKSLGNYLIKGSILNQQGELQSHFDGSVFVTILDKPNTVQTLNPGPGVTATFKTQNSVVSKVRASVKSGKFEALFILPKDLNYDFGKGKIVYYAQSNTEDAKGIDTNYTVGGFSNSAEVDHTPPIVEAFIDNDLFKDGGITGPDPLLFVKLFDDHGINVSGSSIGHDLMAILDDDLQHPFLLNDYYQTSEGDYRRGYVYFPLHNLPEGKHRITVKAWDVYNNSGEGVVHFEVVNKDRGFIGDLYNYPNPVTSATHFVFQHNQAGEKMEVTIRLFDASGALKWSTEKELTPQSNRTEILWDGRGTNGQPLAKGLYFYQLQIKTTKGLKASANQKLILLKP